MERNLCLSRSIRNKTTFEKKSVAIGIDVGKKYTGRGRNDQGDGSSSSLVIETFASIWIRSSGY